MKKTIKAHEVKEGEVKSKLPDNAIPTYLLDREETNRSKILSNTIKQKRKEKAGKWSVPIPVVKPMTEDEMFQIKYSGKRRKTVREKRRKNSYYYHSNSSITKK